MKWISVDERLPGDARDVLCWAGYFNEEGLDYEHFEVAYYDEERQTWHVRHPRYTVTHWQPLPPPPKAADKIAK